MVKIRRGESGKVLIIAEAGVNHNGSLDMALEMVDVAARAGADVIKFQTFSPGSLASSRAGKAEYQISATGEDESQLEMLRKYELSEADHRLIIKRCGTRGIEFLSTPFDAESVDLLVSLGVARLKIPSGEITNWPLVWKIGGTGKPVIISTGMATAGEVRDALGMFLLGAINREVTPGREAAEEAFTSREGQDYLRDSVILLHCTTQYPAPFGDVNLRAMDTLVDEFQLPAGYSDHTEGIIVPIAAAARGAVVIEKHFTLNKNLPGPDHKASATPDELAEMVKGIRTVEEILGSREKLPAMSEAGNRVVVRKSLTALKPIRAGESFTVENLGVKRPGDGIAPSEYWRYLGLKSLKDYDEDERIEIQS
ncbi:MAG: N-acetylneuraminate synthase [Synergistaceae bacterium]|jgi:N-acetylneuraminate synthase|nr:N-acetylneuraminate synthase [Synergistaceae bacterium]